jgi:PKD repeat protein
MFRCLTRRTIRLAVAAGLMALMLLVGLSCAKTPAPTAAFTGAVTEGDLITDKPITGLAPLTIKFTDKSTGEITEWRWNFGDGSPIFYERNPSHTYTVDGKYTVQLVVKGPGGSDPEVKTWFANILSISEAANQEVNQAREAISKCMTAAGVTQLAAEVAGWDGSSDKVLAGGGAKDAADYLTRKPFKAKYDVAQDGTIYGGDPAIWGSGIVWDTSYDPDRWRAVGD